MGGQPNWGQLGCICSAGLGGLASAPSCGHDLSRAAGRADQRPALEMRTAKELMLQGPPSQCCCCCFYCRPLFDRNLKISRTGSHFEDLH